MPAGKVWLSVSTTMNGWRINVSAVAVGIWLLLAPFILGYWGVARIAANEMATGALFLLLVAWSAATSRKQVPAWLQVYLGFWLAIAPFILGYSALRTAGFYAVPMWNSVICGCVLMGLGFARARPWARECSLV